MDRLRTAAISFGVTFCIGYAIGRLLGDEGTGVRTGLTTGAAGAAGVWRILGDTDDVPDFDDGEPIEIEID